MSDDGDDIGTQNTMRERTDESGLRLWVAMKMNRFVLTVLLMLVIFTGFILAATVLFPSLQSQLRGADTLETLFSSMIGVIVTGTTLVVTISQLVISQENGPLGDQRKRMEDAMDFRTFTKDLLGEVTPADPSAFLQALVAETERRAEAVDRLVAESDDEELRSQVGEFVDSLHGNAEAVEDQLDGQQFGTFEVVTAALNYNYSWKIFQVERMLDEFEEVLDEEQTTALDDLKTSLVMFGPAREHIKTLYFQWVLIDLSRYILYVSVPALVVAGTMTALVNEHTFPPPGPIEGLRYTVEFASYAWTFAFNLPPVTWVTGAAFTFTLAPFLLFMSYILRVLTVAKRTLAIGPLILRSSQR